MTSYDFLGLPMASYEFRKTSYAFIDLNGNFRRQKFTADGVKDQNLFPTKQGGPHNH